MSSQKIGDDCPAPGNSVFQTTLSLENVCGTPVALERPFPALPRHCVQFDSAATVNVTKEIDSSVNAESSFIIALSLTYAWMRIGLSK